MANTPTRAAARNRLPVTGFTPGLRESEWTIANLESSFGIRREVGARRVVVQQVVGGNQVLRGVAGHQLARDAVHPGLLVQAELRRPAAPGEPHADRVEPGDRLLLAIDANRAEQAQLAAAALGLGAELEVELAAQVGVTFQTQDERRVVRLFYDERHARIARRQGANAHFHVVDADRAVEPLLNRRGDFLPIARLGIRGNQRFPFGLREPKEVALGLDFPAIGVLLVVELRGADDLLVVIVPQVRAVAAE